MASTPSWNLDDLVPRPSQFYQALYATRRSVQPKAANARLKCAAFLGSLQGLNQTTPPKCYGVPTKRSNEVCPLLPGTALARYSTPETVRTPSVTSRHAPLDARATEHGFIPPPLRSSRFAWLPLRSASTRGRRAGETKGTHERQE